MFFLSLHFAIYSVIYPIAVVLKKKKNLLNQVHNILAVF